MRNVDDGHGLLAWQAGTLAALFVVAFVVEAMQPGLSSPRAFAVGGFLGLLSIFLHKKGIELLVHSGNGLVLILSLTLKLPVLLVCLYFYSRAGEVPLLWFLVGLLAFVPAILFWSLSKRRHDTPEDPA